jgi:hypothetical protein
MKMSKARAETGKKVIVASLLTKIALLTLPLPSPPSSQKIAHRPCEGKVKKSFFGNND